MKQPAIAITWLLLFGCRALWQTDTPTPTPYLFPELHRFPDMPTAPDNPVTNEGVDLGRHLFYDPILSADSSISCASCHRQKAAFSDAPNGQSIGISGQIVPRNTMPLFNLAWYPAMFWDGRAPDIEQQALHPVRAHNEMNLAWPLAEKRLQSSKFYRRKFRAAFGNDPIDSTHIVRAIAQFERTLLSYRSKYDRFLAGKAKLTPDESKGFNLVNDMTKGDCLHCHTTDADPLGTARRFSNNGLDAITDPNNYPDRGRGGNTGRSTDMGTFKIPSLRNVALTPPYMHDGRFATLEAVIDFYSEVVHRSANADPRMSSTKRGGVHLTPLEKKQIIAFLHTLTDSAFIAEPAFSNPFKN